MLQIFQCFMILYSFLATAELKAAAIRIDSEQLHQGQSLDHGAAIVLDPGQKLTLEALLKQQPSPFREHKKDLAFGYSAANLWLRFELENPQNEALDLILSIPYPMLDFIELYTMNGEQVELIARSGDTQSLRSRYIESRIFSFPVTLEAQSTRVFYAVAHTTSSLNVPLRLWDRASFAASVSSDQTLNGCFFGLLIGLAFYNLFIFFATDYSRSYGWYVAFMVSLIGYYLAWTGIGTQLIWAESTFLVQKGFAFFGHSVALSIYCFQLYFLDLKKNFPAAARCYRYTISYCGLAMLSIGAGVPAHIAQPAVVVCGGVTALITFTVATVLAFRGNRQAKFFVLAWSCFLFFIALGLAITFGMVSLPISVSTYGSQIGSSLECILLAIGLADRINQLQAIKNQQAKKIEQQITALERAGAELRDINENLEQKVQLKTQEVRNLLDHIPQGVFTIEAGLIISPQYSSQLTELLGREDLAGKTFAEVFLAGTRLSSDEKDRILQSLTASIGTDAVSFFVNAGHLPAELEYSLYPQNSKVFGVTWNIEADADNVGRRILVTVLDITQAKIFEVELNQRERVLLLVKELIECGAESFAKFLGTSGPLLAESEKIIESNQFDSAMMRLLFLNAHTAKGAARTLGLSLLSNVIHEAENYYTAVIKYNAPMDPARIKLDMTEIRRVFDAYLRTDRDTLGRLDKHNRVEIDKGFLEAHCLRMLQMERQLRSKDDPEKATAALASLEQMVQLIYNSLPFIVEDCLSQSEKIAKDLGKPVPALQCDLINIAIPKAVEDVLRKVSVHLIRNAMDHGIESAEERLKQGKDPRGRLYVHANLERRVLTVTLQDDGRGLNISRLRHLARSRGTLKPEASDFEVAQTIFGYGTSTSSSISEVSGRGIGMDAVKHFIEDIGGHIVIEFLQDQKKAEGYLAFQTKLIFPLAWDENQWILVGESEHHGRVRTRSA